MKLRLSVLLFTFLRIAAVRAAIYYFSRTDILL